MTLHVRIIFWLLAIIGLVGGTWAIHHHGYTAGYEQRELEHQAAEAAAEKAARATEAKQTQTLIGAIDARTQTKQRLAADAAAAHLERDRMRDAFAHRARGLSALSADACTIDRAAYAELLQAVGQAVDQLAADAERIALEADGHAADSLMYQRIGGLSSP